MNQKQIDFFNNLKPFKTVNDIPDLPYTQDSEEYKNIVCKNLIRCGAISKKELIIGKTYQGSCRNSEFAVWNGKKFVYSRCKFGDWFEDQIPHFEDEMMYDVFIPIK